MEQVCHHPPISYSFIVGPDNLYRWYGYSTFKPRAHMNSIDLDVTGGKQITFKDGGKIEYTPHQDKFINTLWGTLIHNICGKCDFSDEANGITGWYEIGGAKGKGRDYIVGEVCKDGKVVAKLFGTYMGYLEFDGERWWDVRKMVNFPIVDLEIDKSLKSDWRNRTDTRALRAGDVEEAQICKDT